MASFTHFQWEITPTISSYWVIISGAGGPYPPQRTHVLLRGNLSNGEPVCVVAWYAGFESLEYDPDVDDESAMTVGTDDCLYLKNGWYQLDVACGVSNLLHSEDFTPVAWMQIPKF